jgi:hypothetical protein
MLEISYHKSTITYINIYLRYILCYLMNNKQQKKLFTKVFKHGNAKHYYTINLTPS